MSDIIGLVFDRLTVLKQDGQYKNGTKLYLCECQCGKTCRTSRSHLKQGAVRSCGCLGKETSAKNGRKSKIDIAGKKFGFLTVLQEDATSKYGLRWMCRCDCGKCVDVLGVNLRRGTTKSCGCIASATIKRNKLKRSKNPWMVDMYHYQLSAEKRNVEFKLTEQEFKKLVSANCFYCGRDPGALCYAAELREDKVYRGGIDRVDSNTGYQLDNCVPCCKYCNMEKAAQSVEDFVLNTKLRYEFLKGKGML